MQNNIMNKETLMILHEFDNKTHQKYPNQASGALNNQVVSFHLVFITTSGVKLLLRPF